MWESFGENTEEVFREIGRKIIEQIDEKKVVNHSPTWRGEGFGNEAGSPD